MPPKPPMEEEEADAESAAPVPAPQEMASPMEGEQAAEGTEEPVDEEAAGEVESDGYMLCLKNSKTRGLSVCKKPLPTEAEPTDGANYEEVQVEDITQGVKAILGMYRQEPLGQDERAAFKAGYEGNPAQKAGGY